MEAWNFSSLPFCDIVLSSVSHLVSHLYSLLRSPSFTTCGSSSIPTLIPGVSQPASLMAAKLSVCGWLPNFSFQSVFLHQLQTRTPNGLPKIHIHMFGTYLRSATSNSKISITAPSPKADKKSPSLLSHFSKCHYHLPSRSCPVLRVSCPYFSLWHASTPNP